MGARRFGVAQEDDLRPVDDFSVFGQNATSDTPERVDPSGVDSIIGLAKFWQTSLRLGACPPVDDDTPASTPVVMLRGPRVSLWIR
jgi:hypothetical protein